jgi:3-deoxy-manno-octulosonate cytidylyltransferase (CMP-KDO synthetase)
MTRSDHESGTLRLAEVARLRGWEGSQIVVNVQGDEPLIPPALIRQVATVLEHTPQAAMATLMTPIDSAQELINPNVVKVVTTAQGLASYFTRAPVPWSRDDYAQGITATTPIRHAFRHIGIYAYRVEFLLAFGDLAPAPTEQIESLEQLRALYHGCAIAVEAACTLPGPGIDTPDDLERVRAILASH